MVKVGYGPRRGRGVEAGHLKGDAFYSRAYLGLCRKQSPALIHYRCLKKNPIWWTEPLSSFVALFLYTSGAGPAREPWMKLLERNNQC